MTLCFEGNPSTRVGCHSHDGTNMLQSPNMPLKSRWVQILVGCKECRFQSTYGCAVKEFPARQMLDCNTAVNNAIRHIFTYHRWQSIRVLRESFGYKSLSDIFAASKGKFVAKLSSHNNHVISRLANISTGVVA